MALNRPGAKMSKSHADPKSRILLTDSRDKIHAKIRSALTDSIEGVSYDPVGRPGVTNLIDIAYHIGESQASSAEELGRDLNGLSIKALKQLVVDRVDEHIKPIRDRMMILFDGKSSELEYAAELGRQKASQSAAGTMKLVRDAVGL